MHAVQSSLLRGSVLGHRYRSVGFLLLAPPEQRLGAGLGGINGLGHTY